MGMRRTGNATHLPLGGGYSLNIGTRNHARGWWEVPIRPDEETAVLLWSPAASPEFATFICALFLDSSLDRWGVAVAVRVARV